MMMMNDSLLKWKNKKFGDAEVRRSLCLLEREKEGEVKKPHLTSPQRRGTEHSPHFSKRMIKSSVVE